MIPGGSGIKDSPTKKNQSCKTTSASWKCPFCCQSFGSKLKLTCHLSTAHGAKEEIVCTQCNKSFASKQGLYNHKAVHEGKLRHVCQKCGKGFLNKQDYEGHMNKHLGLRPHRCHICGHDYTFLNVLMRHIKMHHS